MLFFFLKDTKSDFGNVSFKKIEKVPLLQFCFTIWFYNKPNKIYKTKDNLFDICPLEHSDTFCKMRMYLPAVHDDSIINHTVLAQAWESYSCV